MGQSTLDVRDGTFIFYHYRPSIVAAVIFIALFIITTSVHIFQAAKKRTLYFIPLIVGGVFEFVGYIGRAMAHSNQSSMNIYILQTILLLVAPALFAASIYMVLGRLIVFTHAEAMSPIRANWMTKIFVCGDVLSFLVQAGGGGLSANASSQKLGKNLIVIGLFLQIVFFGLFLVCGIIFQVRLVRTPTTYSVQTNWTKYLYTLYASGTLILIRSLFRIIEFTGGLNGPIMTHEIFIYIFDAVLMVGVMILFNVIHPGAIIGRKLDSEGIRLNEAGTSVEELSYGRK